MKKWMIFIVLLLPAATAFANPSRLPEPLNIIGLIMVLGSTLGLEAIIITIILYFCHMEPMPSLAALITGNLMIYFVIFRPLLSAIDNLLVAELIIVAADGAFIKMISKIDFFQSEEFKGLKWRTAIISAALGNLVSYYVGTVIVG